MQGLLAPLTRLQELHAAARGSYEGQRDSYATTLAKLNAELNAEVRTAQC